MQHNDVKVQCMGLHALRWQQQCLIYTSIEDVGDNKLCSAMMMSQYMLYHSLLTCTFLLPELQWFMKNSTVSKVVIMRTAIL